MTFQEYWIIHGEQHVNEWRSLVQSAFEAGREAGELGLGPHKPKPSVCPRCKGYGAINRGMTHQEPCPDCGGRGYP